MRKTTSKMRVFPIIYFILLIMALCLVGSGVYAKYVKKDQATGAVKAKAFYFKSDRLTAEGSEYTLSADTTEVTFTLENFADALRYTEDDIQYTLTVTPVSDADGCTLTLLEGSDTDVSSTAVESTLSGNTISKHQVQLSGLKPGGSYTVQVKGTAGYIADLKAVFKVAPDKANVYKHVTVDGPEVILTVWTENVSGTVDISFSEAGLIPDNTSPVLAGLKNYDADEKSYKSFSNYQDPTALGTYSSRTYRFLKDSSYEGGTFTVEVGGVAATDAEPQ